MSTEQPQHHAWRQGSRSQQLPLPQIPPLTEPQDRLVQPHLDRIGSARRGWPKLSETLHGLKHPDLCQSCGSTADLHVWQEYDDNDQPTPVVLVLCLPCGEKLVPPHKRLYNCLPHHAPFPGVMHFCAHCRYRTGVSCTHPAQKRLGGSGLRVVIKEPLRGFACSRGNKKGQRCDLLEIYDRPPLSCDGFDPDPDNPYTCELTEGENGEDDNDPHTSTS